MTTNTAQSVASREQLRALTRGAYDIQKLRIMMGNRIVAQYKARMGQAPGKKEEDSLEEKDLKVLAMIRANYNKMMDGLKTFPRRTSFQGNEIISTYTELVLFSQYVDLEENEKNHFKMLGRILEEFPIWTHYLEGVRGIGPAIAAVLISEIDIHKAEYPSSLHALAGLDVASDGRGRGRFKEHLVERQYTNKDGEPATRVGITFNPFLKTKLMGVAATSFLRSGKDSEFAKVYYDYKHRLENHPAHKEKTLKHRHNMALRYMVKRFLVELYKQWRDLEGLVVAPEYSEAKLGMVHKKA